MTAWSKATCCCKHLKLVFAMDGMILTVCATLVICFLFSKSFSRRKKSHPETKFCCHFSLFFSLQSICLDSFDTLFTCACFDDQEKETINSTQLHQMKHQEVSREFGLVAQWLYYNEPTNEPGSTWAHAGLNLGSTRAHFRMSPTCASDHNLGWMCF